MKVRLQDLKPNPVRDFSVDPLDEEAVERLRASIREHGFWGGVVGRRVNGFVEIGAGHHRVEAAIREGVEEGEVYLLPDADERQMIRLYAEENATQRGSANSTARAGSVAAALRQAAYEVLTGDLSEIQERSEKSAATTNGQIVTQRGIGEPVISEYLAGVPGINKGTVTEDLASLKKSGEYARIIAEVRDRITADRKAAERMAEQASAGETVSREAEAARARDAEERAEKAAAKAAEQEVLFDFKGAAAHLRVALQLKSFRDIVTSESVRPYLPVDQQEQVAAAIVRLANETEQELTGLFIRTHVVEVIAQIREAQRALDVREKEWLLAADWTRRFSDLQEHYLGALRNVAHYGSRLLEHVEKAPANVLRPVRSSYREVLRTAQETICRVEEEL